MTEAYTNPLQTIVKEIKNISPETTNALIFRNNGEIVADTQATTENQSREFTTTFADIALQAQTIGGIENFSIQTPDSELNIVAVDDCFLATVSSRQANQEILKSLTKVLVPTVVRLFNQVNTHTETQPLKAEPEEEKTAEENALPDTKEPELKPTIEAILEPQPPFEPFLPKTPTNQFMVEKINGLLVAADTVRIDGRIVASWSELYEGKQFSKVIVEALDGKKTTCKFKEIKESKNSGKGIIQIPEKILQTLQTEKGKLVMVKPVIEELC